MKKNQFEIFKTFLKQNIENSSVEEVYKLFMHNTGILHGGTILEKEQAFMVYSTRLKMMSTDHIAFESLKRFIRNLEKTTDNKIINYTLIFSDISFSIYSTYKDKNLIGILETSNLNYKKMKNLRNHYKEKQFDVDLYFFFENGEIVENPTI